MSTIYRQQKDSILDEIKNNINQKSNKSEKQIFTTRAGINSRESYNSLPSKSNTKEALGCIFLSRRSNITIDKLKTTSNDYIFDLTNTWDLNLELLLNFSVEAFKKQNEIQEIKTKIGNIKNYFNVKNSKRQDLGNCKGKLLIEKQIIEEHKRKIEENYEMYRDQIREMEENVDNKEEYIKIFEKKLREVEIYVQKNTKMLNNTKFDKYKNFIMNDFINENTDLLKKRENLENERFTYGNYVNEAKDENILLKKNSKFEKEDDIEVDDVNDDIVINFTEKDEKMIEKIISSRLNTKKIPEENSAENNINTVPNRINIYNYNNNLISRNNSDKRSEKLKKNDKFKSVLNSYNNHIKLIETKNKLLRCQMKDLHNKFLNQNKLKKIIQTYRRQDQHNENRDLDRTFDNGGNQFNIVENTNNITFIEKSNVNLDLTRKLATYMDFSVVLNKRDETNFHDLSANKTSDNIFNTIHNNQEKHIWDVSCIEKN